MNLTDNQAMAISTAWACIGILIGFSTFAEGFPLPLLGFLLGLGWLFLSIPVFPRISQTFLKPEYRKPKP